MNKHVTFNRFITEHLRNDAADNQCLIPLLNDIVTGCKSISDVISKGDLIGVLGSAEVENVQGEEQKKLDILTNDILIEATEWSGNLAGMVSEELELSYPIPKRFARGKYLMMFDPLDGSSNADVNVTVGSIFSILRCPDGVIDPQDEDFLQPGAKQVCAGYTLYGPSTMLVLTMGNGVNGFTLNHDIGEFILTHPNMKVPKDTSEFAINMSNQRFWEPPIKRYVAECIEGTTGVAGKDFNMRWVASMVAEVHRILVRGGIYMYPLGSKDSSSPGRLRLMYEINPMAFIVEQAGGSATDGRQRVLDIKPSAIHQRVPIIIGSSNEVTKVAHYYNSN
jgi:fructose-1,6-bisphosphatase I